MPKDKLINEAQRVLSVDKELIEVNIYNSVLEGKIKIEKSYGQIRIRYLAVTFSA